jgi:glutathione S-transferase
MSGLTQGPMTERPILYSFRRCPYAMRARMAIAVSGIEVALREVVLREKPAEMLTASPKGTVPVLVLPDGQIIDESLDIMRWALGENDPENWLAGEDQVLIAHNDGAFKAALDRYKYPHRYDIVDAEPYRADGMTFLTLLDDRLADQDWLGGEKPSLSDIAIFPFVRQFAATNQIWFENQSVNNLKNWLNRLVTSSLFESIMRRFPQWRTGDPETVFT